MDHGSQQVWVLSGVILTKIHVFDYLLNYNYQTTLQAGPCRHGWIVLVSGPREKKKRNSPGDACLLGQRKERKNTQGTIVSWAWWCCPLSSSLSVLSCSDPPHEQVLTAAVGGVVWDSSSFPSSLSFCAPSSHCHTLLLGPLWFSLSWFPFVIAVVKIST